MQTEILTRRDELLIRRLILRPGEAMPWHTDPCRRFSVVVRGDRLRIEFRENGGHETLEMRPGLAGWDEPEPRVHRGVNVSAGAYEEVVMFFLDAPGVDPQPTARAERQAAP